MTRTPLDTGDRWAVLGVVVFFLTFACALAKAVDALALVNESPSLPRGLYARAPDAQLARGAVVAVPQPSTARPYLAGLGMPRAVLLLKRIGAVGGDRVCRTGLVVQTPGRVSPVLEQDRRGQALPAWTGCRVLEPNELFLLGDTPTSFDSRYFGPVDRSAVRGVFREVLTW